MKKQTEIPDIDKTFNNNLSKAIHELKEADFAVKAHREKLDACKQLVVIEMKKVGKDYLKIQLDGEMWEAEVKRTEERLSFKKSRV